MAEHKAIYKCRLCGRAFEDCTEGEELAQMMTLALATVGTTKYVKCNGELYACKPDIFEKTYERVD